MKYAAAKISGGEKYPQIYGKVIFAERGKNVLVTAHITGLPKTETNIFAFHIHQGSDCKGENFENTKGHLNLWNDIHPKHTGDMPPLFSNDGKAFLSFETNRFTICNIINKTVVIHEKPDDFTSQPSGNAGEKIACGIIKG
ncbi:MAG: superoxide dismutase family protein [Clostridia bacterium]